MRLTFCLAFCLTQILSYANANKGKYTIIAPGTIHSNDKYTAAVSVRYVSQPCHIKVGITGPSFKIFKHVKVSENKVKNVDFDLPTLEYGDYNLTAEGVNCLNNFKNTTRLIYNKFSNHVRIQTEKGIYKPGDDINFRVLFMDKDLKPARPEKDAVIWLEDGKCNRIEEIRDFKTVKGVYTGKFKISELPVFGIWRMGVKTIARFDRYVFLRVVKYDLPRHVVKIEAPGAVSVKDGDLQVIVRADYTYGKPMDGKVTVALTLNSYYNFYSSQHSNVMIKNDVPPTLIKTADIVKGKAKIDFNVKEYKFYLPYNSSPCLMTIVATVDEQFTGVKINSTSFCTVFPYRYSLKYLSYATSTTFDVGKENDVLFQITYIDGTYINDTKSPIELIYKDVFSYDFSPYHKRASNSTIEPPVTDNITVSFTSRMNETGFVNFKVSLPNLPEYEGYSHYYSLELKYLDEQRQLYSTYQHRERKKEETPKGEEEDEKSKKYFMLLGKFSTDKKLYLNKADQFTLSSSQPLPYFNFNIIGRGNILKSGHVDLPDKPKVYNLTLTPKPSWAPCFGVYAYYVDEKGEYHYAEQIYYVDFELQNQINITAAKQVSPGQEVALKIQTTPNSFVGLMAVDQNALLLRPNNDLTSFEFNWVLDSYSTYTPPQGGYSKYPGTTSGCVTLTNADYFYDWTTPDYLSDRFSFFSNNTKHKTAVRRVTRMASDDQGALEFSSGTASSGGGAGGVNTLENSNDFSETWLFTDIENTESAEFTLSKKIPETITSWVLTAFSLHPTKGLAVTRDQTNIKTFQSFFISIRLPYSIKLGEIINVPALVFNYLDNALDVEVTLENTDNEYEFTAFDNEVISEQKLTKCILVPANEAAEVSFLLRPKVIGNIMLKFTAISAVAGDVKHKSMRVVPEGVTQYINRAYYVNLNKERKVKTSFELNIPEDSISGTEYVEVGVMGDILSPVLNNLDNLVRLPNGCGEQTISALLPNYLVMKYLQNSKRLTPWKHMETKLRYNLGSGYQTLLNYRHDDGSFSSFGPPKTMDNPGEGSTWLTAYVIRSLQQIKEFVNVEDKIIEEGLAYLIQQQAPNGAFTEKDDYFYASHRNHITITGAAVLAFQENATYAEKYSQELRNGLEFIAQNIDKTDSLYAQALGTYTLNKAKHAVAKEKISNLKFLAKIKSNRVRSAEKKPIIGSKWSSNVVSTDVEIMSYTLLTLLDQDSAKLDDVESLIRWLIPQRNSNGGFNSAEDTVVGLTALIKFAKFTNYKPAKMAVNIKSDFKEQKVKLTDSNGIEYQNIQMPSETKSIHFTAKGTGTALVQISYQYNTFVQKSKSSFTIRTTKIENKNRPSHLEMLVCVNYMGKGESSNMAILEISTPSGYVIDKESLTDIMKIKKVGNTELKNYESMLVVYFDRLLRKNETCLTIEALRTHAVAMQRPASILLYDYYDTSKKATAFYEVDTNLCAICDSQKECNKCN